MIHRKTPEPLEPLPTLKEVEEAWNWLGIAYQSDSGTANEYWGSENFAAREPDGGLLYAVHQLHRILAELGDRRIALRGTH
jgi:hypothetical protein